MLHIRAQDIEIVQDIADFPAKESSLVSLRRREHRNKKYTKLSKVIERKDFLDVCLLRHPLHLCSLEHPLLAVLMRLRLVFTAEPPRDAFELIDENGMPYALCFLAFF